jgi:hypothetical protein
VNRSYRVRVFPRGSETIDVFVDAPSSVAALLRAIQRLYPGDGPRAFTVRVELALDTRRAPEHV